jgi:hypothetical protein
MGNNHLKVQQKKFVENKLEMILPILRNYIISVFWV